jgi:tetratricopeptide (TPR) repeat protein
MQMPRLRRPWAVLVVVLLGLSPAAAVAQQANAYYEFLKARRLGGEGDIDGALAALQRAAAADPASAEIRAEMAVLYMRKSPVPRADVERAAKEALTLDPKNAQANRTLGTLYAESVRNARGANASQAAQDVKTAIEYLERAAAATVGVDLELLFSLGQMYLRNNEPEKAVQTVSRVAQQNPGIPQVHQLLANAYAASGNVKGAIASLSDVVEFVPSLAVELARYLEQDGQLREAAAAYTIALTQRPSDRQLKLQRIVALLKAKEFGQAAAFAGEARKQHPDDVNFPVVQSQALFEAGDRSGAIAVAEAAAKTFPRDLSTQWNLVDLYSDAGRSNDTERVLRQILAAEPSDPRALNHLGYLLATRGEQLDEAVALVRRALASDPERPEYLDSLGWAHFKRGELNEAVKYLSAAAAKLPSNSEVQDHLGDVHARRGSYQEAIAAWTKALAGDGQGIEKTAVERKLEDARRKLPR